MTNDEIATVLVATLQKSAVYGGCYSLAGSGDQVATDYELWEDANSELEVCLYHADPPDACIRLRLDGEEVLYVEVSPEWARRELGINHDELDEKAAYMQEHNPLGLG